MWVDTIDTSRSFFRTSKLMLVLVLCKAKTCRRSCLLSSSSSLSIDNGFVLYGTRKQREYKEKRKRFYESDHYQTDVQTCPNVLNEHYKYMFVLVLSQRPSANRSSVSLFSALSFILCLSPFLFFSL